MRYDSRLHRPKSCFGCRPCLPQFTLLQLGSSHSRGLCERCCRLAEGRALVVCPAVGSDPGQWVAVCPRLHLPMFMRSVVPRTLAFLSNSGPNFRLASNLPVEVSYHLLSPVPLRPGFTSHHLHTKTLHACPTPHSPLPNSVYVSSKHPHTSR